MPSTARLTRPLGQILLESGVINTGTLQEALSRTSAGHEQLGAVLIAMGAAGQEDVRRALAAQQGIPYLMTEQLPSTLPPLKCLSPKYLRQYVACPIAVKGSTISVATADPTNPVLLDDLRQSLGQSLGITVRLCVAPPQAILETIEASYGTSTPSVSR